VFYVWGRLVNYIILVIRSVMEIIQFGFEFLPSVFNIEMSVVRKSRCCRLRAELGRPGSAGLSLFHVFTVTW